jgi:hypothetical protein
MIRRADSPEQLALRKSWSRWTAIIGLFARRRLARKRVNPQAYAALRRQLIKECRVCAASANEVDAVFYRHLEALAEPWLDPGTLGRADREILFDLLLRCQHAESELGGRSRAQGLRSRQALTVAAAMTFAFMLFWAAKYSILLRSTFATVRGWADDFSFRIVHSSDLERLFVVGCVLIAVSIYTVMRSARD